MTQTSLPWANNGVGDGQAYSDDEWSDWQRKAFTHDRTRQGVIVGYGSELEVTNPAGATIRVATGAAWVDGKFYENDANVDNTVTAPAMGSNYYRFVLQKDWSAQTVRIAVLGPNAFAPPTVTQTDGTLWEVSLATVQITFAGVVTITDTRYFIGTPMTAGVEAWQSGFSHDWSASPGTTNWTPYAPRMQGGLIEWTGAGASSGTKAVTFPRAFTTQPAIFLQSQSTTVVLAMVSLSATGFTFSFVTSDGGSITSAYVQWLAIGE